jgi:hypothetical protein
VALAPGEDPHARVGPDGHPGHLGKDADADHGRLDEPLEGGRREEVRGDRDLVLDGPARAGDHPGPECGRDPGRAGRGENTLSAHEPRGASL